MLIRSAAARASIFVVGAKNSLAAGSPWEFSYLPRLVISSETQIARKEAARSTLAVFCSIPANGGCVRLGRRQPAWSLQEARRPSGAARERRCARRGAEPTQNSPARDIGGLFDRRLGV